jgi:uncharacterized membrane protein YfcA
MAPLTLLAFAVALVGVASGATAALVGFGIGSLLTPLLAAQVGADAAIALVALPHLAATALRFVRHRAHVDIAALRAFGIPSALGGLAGALLYARLGDRGLGLVLGVLLVATGAMNALPALRRWRPSPATSRWLGLASGLFGGLAGNQGGLRAAALLPLGLAPRAFLATSTAIALVIDGARTPVYLVRAAPTIVEHAPLVAIASVACLLGTLLGERGVLRADTTRYRRVVAIAVVLAGAWMLARALVTR